MSFKKLSPFLILACIMSASGCKSINKRIDLLENQAATVKAENERLRFHIDRYNRDLREVDQTNIEIRHKTAGTRADIAEIGEKIKSLAGRIEELEHHFSNEINTLKDLFKTGTDAFKASEENINNALSGLSEKISFNHDRLKYLRKMTNAKLEKFKSAARPGLAGKSKPVRKHESGPMSPKELYAFAKKAFDKKDFKTAKDSFLYFLKRNPNSLLAGSSQFWLGEIYYREKKYERAIVEYQNVLEKYPGSNKVPGALLKQGFAFIKIGDSKSSSLFFNELIRRFPGSAEERFLGCL